MITIKATNKKVGAARYRFADSARSPLRLDGLFGSGSRRQDDPFQRLLQETSGLMPTTPRQSRASLGGIGGLVAVR
jgi:hypothetical protein